MCKLAEPDLDPPAAEPVTLRAKSPSAVVDPVAMVNGVVVGVAELGKATEAASVGVEPAGAPLKASTTLLGNPMTVEPGVRLTVAVYAAEQERSMVTSAGARETE
jgi:hypothetical protein